MQMVIKSNSIQEGIADLRIVGYVILGISKFQTNKKNYLKEKKFTSEHNVCYSLWVIQTQ